VRDDGDAEREKSAAGAETTTVSVVEWVRFGVVVVPVTVMGYDPAGVEGATPMVRPALAELFAAGVTEVGLVEQVIPLPPLQAPPVVSATGTESPFKEVTVTEPLAVPPEFWVKVKGEADSVMLKSGDLTQLLNLKEPMAVAQPTLLETG
jgi:hypothetical protein